MRRHVLAVVAPMMMGVAGAADAAEPPQPRTAAAVLAADNAWTEAEIRGDAAFVEALLLPEYRSVGQGGKITSKAQIVDSTRKRGSRSDFGARVAAYRANHPTRGDVTLLGDTAVLTWISLIAGHGEPVTSCDVFVYRAGHWHALYSQHSTAET